jgi:large subunit ribosomal protein L19
MALWHGSRAARSNELFIISKTKLPALASGPCFSLGNHDRMEIPIVLPCPVDCCFFGWLLLFRGNHRSMSPDLTGWNYPSEIPNLLRKYGTVMANIIQSIESKYIRNDHPEFRPGDTLRVHFRIREGEKERVQVFEGVCIAQHRGGNRSTITVRKVSFSQQGVERIFPLASPRIEKIEVTHSGRVRRAKLFYLRSLRGKKARIRSRMEFRNKVK